MREWFSEIYERHLESAVRGARAVLASDEEALDVAQTIFARLWSKGLVPGQSYSSGFFARSARNEALNLKKRLRRFEAILPAVRMHSAQSSRPDQSLYQDEIDNLVVQALQRLPTRCRAVARLRYESGLTAPEIGIRLGITEKAVRKQLARARRHLEAVHKIVQTETPESPRGGGRKR